jgi:DNA-binding response OmpR family regulator
MMTAFSLDNLTDLATEEGVIGSFHKPLAFPEVEALLDRVRQETRVLIVDDDVDFAREIRDMLEIAGFSVRSCFDGQTAIRRCLEEPFDAMVLDMRLPGASGAEVCSAVREACPDLRIVAITGLDTEELASENVTTHPIPVLHKPFNPDSLLRMLEHVPGTG